MFLENDKINIIHRIKSASNLVALISRGNMQIHQRLHDQSIGFSVSYFLIALLLNSKLDNLNFALNY